MKKVALALGILALAAQAQAQVVTPTRSFTHGTIVALNELAGDRSGVEFGFLPPIDPDMPATLLVKLVAAVGLTQTINVFTQDPPDPNTPPDLTLILHPPDPGMPTGRIEIVGACSPPR